MATITGLTADRMITIEASSIVDAHLSGDNLILEQFDGTEINVGSVRGPTGFTPELRGVSVTSLAIGTGSKTFAINPAMNVPFAVGSVVRAVGATATNFMVGVVTAATTTSVTINVTQTGGTGTFASWTLALGAFDGTLAGHNHDASAITTGVLDLARIPAHGHAAADITSGILAAARVPQATETAIGALEIATTAEVRAAVSNLLAVTPAGLGNSVEVGGSIAGDNYYEKHPNGLLICRAQFSFSSASAVVSSTWTFGHAFVGEFPWCMDSVESSALNAEVSGSCTSITLTTCQVNHWRTSSTATTHNVMAIGRWK